MSSLQDKLAKLNQKNTTNAAPSIPVPPKESPVPPTQNQTFTAPPTKTKVPVDLLAGLELAKKAANEVESEYPQIPDGTYEAIIENAEFKQSKGNEQEGKPKRDMLVLTIKITEGEHIGRLEFMNLVYGGAEDWAALNAKTMYTLLDRFGVDISTPERIVNTFDQIFNKETLLIITTKPSQKTGKPSRRVNLRKPIAHDHNKK